MAGAAQREVVKVLREGGSVRLSGNCALGARTFRGYRGRNPMTGAVVDVPAKMLPLLHEATSGAVDLGLEESEVLSGTAVRIVPGIGFIVGLDGNPPPSERKLLPLASFRMALNGVEPARPFADDRAVRAALAPSGAVARLVAHRAGRPASADLVRVEQALGGSLPPLALDAIQQLAGCEVAPLTFEHAVPSEGVEGVSFASLSDFSWRLVIEHERARVIETSGETTEALDLDVFLAQAALVVAVTDAAGDLSLSEDAARDVMRAMLEVHPSPTRLTGILPF